MMMHLDGSAEVTLHENVYFPWKEQVRVSIIIIIILHVILSKLEL